MLDMALCYVHYRIVIFAIIAADFIVTLCRCAATCFNHYVFVLRLSKYIKTKITVAILCMGGGVKLTSQCLVAQIYVSNKTTRHRFFLVSLCL